VTPHEDELRAYPLRPQAYETRYLAPPPARRQPVNPLRAAVPLALVAFVGTLAATATLSHPREVERAIGAQIVPSAAAAQKPRRRAVAPPKALFVPDVTGLKAKRATTRLKQARFRPKVRFASGPAGVVLEQRPRAASELRPAGIVRLVVGRAAPQPKPEPRIAVAPPPVPTVIVASVVGLPREVAAKALVNEGLGVRVYGVPSRQPAGTVVAQHPRTGTRAKAGSYARINVAVH
jgi:hypothetical protein